MTRLSVIDKWLEDRLTKNQNGIIVSSEDNTAFGAIQDFLESKDHSFKTPAIYYSAFIDDSPVEFKQILIEELSSKLGLYRSKSCSTASEIIAMSELQMVIVDRCYLHSSETMESLLNWLNEHGVGLILVGSQAKMNRVQFLQRPSVANLLQLRPNTYQYDVLPISC